ncbi:Vps62-related protein [Streptomyces sp. NPDC058989]|uniref:Vps62-related protein n=1 Tax=Streptomyces sp. NPDC058989 TaxID=3346686 RepID=UPI00367D2870
MTAQRTATVTETSAATTTQAAPAAVTTQRYGHLELGFTTSMKTAWFASTSPAGLYNPLSPDSSSGWRSLGTVFCSRTEDAVLMVKDHSPQKDLLVSPSRYQGIVSISMSGRVVAKVWRPVPPSSDYVALGVYVTDGADPPSDAVACVKKTHSGRTYARHGELSSPVDTALFHKMFRYNIAPLYPHGDAEEHLILPVGRLSVAGDTPAPNETTWVLDVPAVVEKFDGPDTPDLENYNPPPNLTMITDRAVTVPFYMVDDKSRPTSWKVENSPFYKILRKRQFRLVRHVDFRGGGGGQISETVEQGVSKEKSEEFSLTTGIEVGVSVGVEASAKPFGMGASTTVTTSVSTSIETGYTSRYGVTTMESKTVGVTYNVPADHAGALWVESHELLPVRADNALVTNATLKFDSGSYIGRTYPHSNQPPPQVSPQPASDQQLTSIWEIADDLTETVSGSG